MHTARQVQKFQALKRKTSAKKRAAGKGARGNFTVASANDIKRQPLDVSGVEILEHEINPDY
ncbi:MAG TPA: hypothetical protein VFC44_02685 [Candidatus Saccharimonadales bacterium]|nr:hypothetical protein [Candidatus Saccharimonadales bacterium]